MYYIAVILSVLLFTGCVCEELTTIHTDVDNDEHMSVLDTRTIFLGWSVANGIWFDPVDLIPASDTVDEYTLPYMMPGEDRWKGLPRGLKATRRISAGETVIRVPESIAISAQTALEDPEIGPVLSNYSNQGKLLDRTPLAIYLLFQRNKGAYSPWAPYINLLPKKIHTPMLWTKEEREELKGTWVLDRTMADLKGIVSDYHNTFTKLLFKHHRSLFDPANYTLDDYVWAWNTIWSRAITINVDINTGESSTAVSTSSSDVFSVTYLIPLIDMAMHPPVKNSTGQRNKEYKTRVDLIEGTAGKEFVMIVNNDYDKGEQIFRPWVNTGTWIPNVELLRMHGIIDPGSHELLTAINAGLDKSDPDYDTKKLWLQMHGLSDLDYPYNKLWVGSKGPTAAVAAYLRVHHFTEMDGAMRRNPKRLPDPFKRISAENERQVVKHMQHIIDQKLSRFPTTKEEDEKILEDDSLSYHKLLAVEIRLEERMALTQARDRLATRTVRIGDEGSDSLTFTSTETILPQRSARRHAFTAPPVLTGEISTSSSEGDQANS